MHEYKILKFDTIDSTNDYLKENYRCLDEYTVATSKIQTKGKGRLGRVWTTPSGNLAFSILLKPTKKDISILTLLSGVAILKTLNKYTKCMIKWPNDILVNDKKVCGILAESIISNKIDALVIGIGININQTEFDIDIKDKATSLKLLLGNEYDIYEILNECIINFDILYTEYLNDNYHFLDIVRNNFYLKDKKGYIDGKEVLIKGIDELGNLIVTIDSKEEHIYSGEVSLNTFYK